MPSLPSRTIAFNTRYTYPSVGHCIYCNRSGQKLGEEHIIPLAFGGTLILPSGSCRRCESIMTRFEDHCTKGLISTARPHLGIRGRQKKASSLTRGPIYVERPSRTETHSTPLREHPGILLMPIMPYPTILLDQPLPSADRPVSVRLAMRPMISDIGQRAAAVMRNVGGRITLTKGVSAIECYRLIAKIAHAFAVAELGYASFTPFLKNIILGDKPMFADHFVGSSMVHDPRAKYMHELDLDFVDKGHCELIVVRVRLFGYLDMPNHYAVVGERPKQPRGQ